MREFYYRLNPISGSDLHTLVEVKSRGDGPARIVADNLHKKDADLIVAALERPEESADYAMQILRRDYYADVCNVAKDLIERIKNGEIEDSEALQDALHDDIDGHQRITYTFQARIGLLCSDNEDALEEEGAGGDNPTPEQRCYWAMRQDVIERLEAEGVDPNAPEDFRTEHLRGLVQVELESAVGPRVIVPERLEIDDMLDLLPDGWTVSDDDRNNGVKTDSGAWSHPLSQERTDDASAE